MAPFAPLATPSPPPHKQNFKEDISEFMLSLKKKWGGPGPPCLPRSATYGFQVTLLSVRAGADPGRDVENASLPPAIFKHVFDEYNFFIPVILSLFDNNKRYALSTHNRKCTNKMRHI